MEGRRNHCSTGITTPLSTASTQSGHRPADQRCPLCPQKQTCSASKSMSALCQERKNSILPDRFTTRSLDPRPTADLPPMDLHLMGWPSRLAVGAGRWRISGINRVKLDQRRTACGRSRPIRNCPAAGRQPAHQRLDGTGLEIMRENFHEISDCNFHNR